jgi:hypothetical protein
MAFVQQATAYQNLTLAREGHFAIVKLNRLKPEVGLVLSSPRRVLGCQELVQGTTAGLRDADLSDVRP